MALWETIFISLFFVFAVAVLLYLAWLMFDTSDLGMAYSKLRAEKKRQEIIHLLGFEPVSRGRYQKDFENEQQAMLILYDRIVSSLPKKKATNQKSKKG